jgi:hypothetical protein
MDWAVTWWGGGETLEMSEQETQTSWRSSEDQAISMPESLPEMTFLPVGQTACEPTKEVVLGFLPQRAQ